jgi:hypothetical protein
MPREFRDLSPTARRAIVDVVCGEPCTTLPEDVQDEIRDWATPPKGCEGPCEIVRAWCPDCDRETEHVRICLACRECRDCGKLSADIVPVDSPA